MLKTLLHYLSKRSTPVMAREPVERSMVDIEALLDAPSRVLAAGDLDEAQRLLDDVISLHNNESAAHLLQGKLHQQRGDLDEARDSYLLATHFSPLSWQAQFELGLLEADGGHVAKAIECFTRSLELAPENARVHNALGAIYLRIGRVADAIAQFRRAIELKPDFADAHSNLGYVLFREMEAFEEGGFHIETAVKLAPGDSAALCNWTLVLQHRGRLREALELSNKLLAANPSFNEVRLNRALILLKQQNFAEGWREYETRKIVWVGDITQDVPAPDWDGSALDGKTIIVLAEQGIGDEIMFASCLPDLIAKAGRCIVETAPKLARLVARSFPDVTVVQKGAWRDAFPAGEPSPDWRVAIGSLPGFFRSAPSDFPSAQPYLRAADERVAYWRQRLDALPGKRKIGISWRGGASMTRSTLRSLPLALWADILDCPDTDFVSLQYSECDEEMAAVRDSGRTVHVWREAIDDYDETAALVSALDLIISVQTAVVHLAGALGTPVWALIPQNPEWRYQLKGETLPWYAHVKLIRQHASNDWVKVLQRVSRELQQFPKRHAHVPRRTKIVTL